MTGEFDKLGKEIIHLKRTRIPRCVVCKKNFVKITEYTWKPTCKCSKKGLRLSIG